MVYDQKYQASPPQDHIRTIAESTPPPPTLSKPQFGIDSCMGLIASSIAAPLYLYSTLKGKFQVWDEILDGLPYDCLKGPALDVGCGRGLVLLKIAERKKKLSEGSSSEEVYPVYGMDIFNARDQSGNSPTATYQNALAMGVTEHTVLHTASFTEHFHFADNAFSLVVSCLAIHNVHEGGRANAIREIARVCKVGGRLIIIDLYGYFKAHQSILVSLGWKDVKVSIVGFRMSYGVLPCQMLIGEKPLVATD